MSYEATVNLVGGDDVALAKSFIIACEGPVLNWNSLLPLHSICSLIDLKAKFIQAFQVFHETSTKPSDLFNCKQRDREPLKSFVRRFMQQKSQILGTDDKTTIQALIKDLTPRPTTSHITGKEPQSIEELFNELEQYIKSDEDHRKRVAERNRIEEQHGGLSFKLHKTSTMWKTLSSTRTIDQAQEEVSHQEEEDLRRSKIMTQEIHTSNADIMGAPKVTSPKLAQKLERT
jgi:hypothetical protein